MLIIHDNKKMQRYEVENKLGKDATAQQVLDYIFGKPYSEYPEYPDATFTVKKWTEDKKTFLNRLNMFWAIPFTLLVSPIHYLQKGYVGWTDKTKMGRLILRLTGHLG